MSRFIMSGTVIITILLFLFGFHYVGKKLYCWLYLMTPNQYLRILLGISLIYILSIVLAFLPFNLSVKKILVWLAWFLVGLYIYFLMIYFFSDIVILIGRIFRAVPTPRPHSFIIAVSWIVAGLVTAITAYGAINARTIKQVSYNVLIEKETTADKLTVVLIADLHLWYINDDKWLAKVVDKINEMEPDLVCIAGDIFNDNLNAVSNPDKAITSLQNIKSTYGVYACLGNHDGGKTFQQMLNFLERGKVVVLQDEYKTIENKFVIVGRKDSSPIGNQGDARKEYELVSAGINENLPVIIIDHNPGNIKNYNKKADLILSGHTHRGQMFPANIITNLMFEYSYGHYNKDKDSFDVVVTSGVGVWGPPLRIGTNNEIVKISVEFK